MLPKELHQCGDSANQHNDKRNSPEETEAPNQIGTASRICRSHYKSLIILVEYHKGLRCSSIVARQRPRATGVRHETERSSRGSLHAPCWPGLWTFSHFSSALLYLKPICLRAFVALARTVSYLEFKNGRILGTAALA